MQLESGDGISCDLCSMQYKMDFDYLSLDFRSIKLINHKLRPAWTAIKRLPVALSLDVCTQCFDVYKDLVVAHNEMLMQGLRCDLSGTMITDHYSHCTVSNVSVRMQGRPFQCKQCSHKIAKAGACPKCGGVTVSVADVHADENYLELNVCRNVYDDIVNKYNSAKTKLATTKSTSGEWTTNAPV